MNAQKFTQKSLEAIQDAQDLAIEYQNMKEDGTVLCRDRYIWSQGQALWTFSALYNRIEPRQEYLRAADGLFRYLSENGRDKTGKWMYLLDENGTVRETDTSIYVDGFVLAGMTESAIRRPKK